MGEIIESKSILREQSIFRLIIYSKSEFAPSSSFPVNKALAAELIKLNPSRRTMQLENCFVKLLEGLPENPVIRDIDAMFNPDYKVDVMKILVSAYKRKPFSLIWPGGCSGDKLTYSEEGFTDYKSFEINDYDIMCVI